MHLITLMLNNLGSIMVFAFCKLLMLHVEAFINGRNFILVAKTDYLL